MNGHVAGLAPSVLADLEGSDDMTAETLHRSSIVIDGTCPADYHKDHYHEWIEGGVTCCAVSVAGMTSARDALSSIGFWQSKNPPEPDELKLVTLGR